MTLQIVPRSVRAIADQLNSYYRVLRGIDAESLVLRLATGGTFEVRHSVTNAPVFSVTDAGATAIPPALSVTNGILAPDAVTSDKILDGAIVNADINAAANISGSKLADGTVTSAKILDGSITTIDIQDRTITAIDIAVGAIGGVEIADGAITSAKIADDAITNVDVNPNAGIGLAKLAHVGAGNVLRSNGSANVGGQVQTGDLAAGAATATTTKAIAGTSTASTTAVDMAGSSFTHTGGGGVASVAITLADLTNTSACQVTVYLAVNGADVGTMLFNETIPASTQNSRCAVLPIGAISGVQTVKLRWYTNAGTINIINGAMVLTELKR